MLGGVMQPRSKTKASQAVAEALTSPAPGVDHLAAFFAASHLGLRLERVVLPLLLDKLLPEVIHLFFQDAEQTSK